MIDRRTFLAGAASMLGAPLVVKAQEADKPPRIATFMFGTREMSGPLVEAFKQGLRDLGYVEGRNVRIDSLYAMARTDNLRPVARELVALRPDVIFVGAAVTAKAAMEATETIPIVGAAFDPLAQGLVKSLSRPGGNLTGLSSISIDISPKLVELLVALTPNLSRLAALLNPDNVSYAVIRRNLRAATDSIGLHLLEINARTPAAVEEAFVRLAHENVRAVIVHIDAFFFAQRRQIAALTLKHRIVSMHVFREMVEAGGLMSYGQNLPDHYRRAAQYVDKILKGARPGDLPIEQSTKLELVINLKTAKALGLTIPPLLLLRADQVIE